MSSFFNENAAAYAVAIPWVISENCQAKNAGNQHFLLFQTMSSTPSNRETVISSTSNLLYADA